MPLPAGVATCDVNITVPVDNQGNAAKSFTGTIEIDRPLVWAATGEPIWHIKAKLPAPVSGVITVPVPEVDQAGMLDATTGAPVTHWEYIIRGTAVWGADRWTVAKRFQVFAATASPYDLDLAPASSILPAVEGEPFVATVAGLSGGVTAQGLVDALETPLSAAYVTQGAPMIDVTKQAGATFAAKLQAAHDGLAALFGGGTILIPAGAHTLSADVTLSSPVRFQGSGRTATKITVDGPRIIAQTGNVVIEDITFEAAADQWLLKTQTSLAEVGRWGIQRCRFVKVGLSLTKCDRDLGTGATEATGTRVGLGSVVRDCELTGRVGNETIYIAGTTGVVVDNCWIHDCGTDVNSGEGIKVLHAATGTRLINNLIERTTRDGIDAYNSIDTTIANNVIRDPGVNGIEIKWNLTETYNTRRTIVQGNRVERSGSTAYNLDSFETIAIGNVAYDCTGTGYRFSANGDGGGTATAHGSFIGNMAIDGSGDGFVGALSTQAVFIGNGAFGNAGTGFLLTGPQALIGNTASGNGVDYASSSSSGSNVAFWGNGGATSPYRLGNNVAISGYKADGTLSELIKVTAAGALNIGSTAAGSPSPSFLVPSGGLFQFNARILPLVTATNDIGSASLKWKDLHLSGAANVAGALDHDGTTVGFYGTAPVTKPTALTAANASALNTGDATSDTVIANMRTRIGELEAKLQSLGLLA